MIITENAYLIEHILMFSIKMVLIRSILKVDHQSVSRGSYLVTLLTKYSCARTTTPTVKSPITEIDRNRKTNFPQGIFFQLKITKLSIVATWYQGGFPVIAEITRILAAIIRRQFFLRVLAAWFKIFN